MSCGPAHIFSAMQLTRSFQSCKEILKHSQILSLGSHREDSTVPRVYFSPLFCLRSSLSDSEQNLSQLQDCGSNLSCSSLNNNFLPSNPAAAGDMRSVLTGWRATTGAVHPALSTPGGRRFLLSPPRVIHQAPRHLVCLSLTSG